MQTLSGHSGGVNAIAVVDEQRVVSGSDDETLKVWDLRSGRCMQTLRGHINWGFEFAFVLAVAAVDEQRVVSASNDKTLKLWDLRSGRCMQTLSGHSGGVNAIAVVDEQRVVSGSFDNTLKLWTES